MTCSFLFACSGYYRYDHGYRPTFAGEADFTGTIVHPQQWPDDLDVDGRRVVVIGSGATAVTLVPALAAQGAQVTMLQRSPSYIATVPSIDRTAERLQQPLAGPGDVSARALEVRADEHGDVPAEPTTARADEGAAAAGSQRRLPAGFDLDTHLTPSYEPWDQRLCATPDGDLFRAIRSGSADIVTEGIDRFTPGGVRLRSGRAARRRRDHHGHRSGAAGLRRDGAGRRRPGGRSRGNHCLQGHDDVRGAELLSHARLHQRLLDAQGGSGGALRLPAAPVSRSSTGIAVATPVTPDLAPEQLTPLIDLQAGYVRRGAQRLPKQGPAHPGVCTRTTCETCGCCAGVR